MKKHFLTLLIVVLCFGLGAFAQADRITVGVAPFSAEKPTPYALAVTEKVVEMLTKSKRFKVVDRTSLDKIIAELELQKSEMFLESERLAQQGALLGADYILTGQIRQISVIRLLNDDETVSGYRASVSFTIKIVETATSVSTEAHSFESRGVAKMLSPERAVDEAIRTLTPQLEAYFTENFPIVVPIVKVLTEKKGVAAQVLISGGKEVGLAVGDKLTAYMVTQIDGKPYPKAIGQLKITALAGNDFAECAVSKGGETILKAFADQSITLNAKKMEIE
jgi:hypothetical protein